MLRGQECHLVRLQLDDKSAAFAYVATGRVHWMQKRILIATTLVGLLRAPSPQLPTCILTSRYRTIPGCPDIADRRRWPPCRVPHHRRPPVVFEAGSGMDRSAWDPLLGTIHRDIGAELITFDHARFGDGDEDTCQVAKWHFPSSTRTQAPLPASSR